MKEILKKITSAIATSAMAALVFVLEHKTISAVVALVLTLAIILTSLGLTGAFSKNEVTVDASSSQETTSVVTSEVSSLIEESSSEPTSSQESSSSEEAPVTSKPVVTSTPVVTSKPSEPVKQNTGFQYNTNLDIEDNVFMDALVYTGYNINKHRADGMMWEYLLASKKRARGWLSNIGYNGGSTGYETTANGLPDIKAFERKGMVCASFVTYVYFNYLPNVAGIDTSSLPKPVDPKLAHDWYMAANQWIKNGYSKSIPFTATKIPAGSAGYVKFNPSESIPIGSIVIFRDARYPNSTHGSHASIYAGYKNGYNWIYHVGNDNGPEFCAIERVLFGPDPQWPLAVITPPSNIRMAAMASVTVKDDSGAAVEGAEVSVKNNTTGAVTLLGKTDANGLVSKEGLKYGDYTVTYTLPTGYTAAETSVTASLTTKNNSLNEILISVVKERQASSVTEEATTTSTTESVQ